jgi:formylglycine-generating enzyme required for sulfatase activity
MAQREGDEEEKQERESLIKRARAYLAEKLPKASGLALQGSVVAGMLVAAGAVFADPSAPFSQAELIKLMSGLGVNWLANLVWELRGQKGAVDIPAEARKIEAQLNDTQLRELYTRLDLIGTTLKSLTNSAERDRWAGEVLKHRIADAPTLQSAAAAANVSISGSVYNSVLLTAGGDISHVTINLNGARQSFSTAVYFAELAHRVSRVDLLSNAAALEESKLEIGQIYTPLSAASSDTGAVIRALKGNKDGALGDGEIFEAMEFTKRPDSLVAALREAPLAIVLGDPGSGKSTVLNYLAVGLCGKLGDSPDEEFNTHWTHTGLLPVHITLRRFAHAARGAALRADVGKHQLLFDYAAQEIQALTREPANPIAAHLLQIAEQNGIVWLLDGLDEVGVEDRRELIQPAIESLCDVYPRCRVIVTCRGYSYTLAKQKLAQRGRRFEELRVLPFEPEQMHQFVRRYYAQLAAQARSTKETNIADLLQALKNRPALQRLGANPLLLTLIVSLHNFGQKRLPNDRVELLRETVDLLLLRWQSTIAQDDARLDARAEEVRQYLERDKTRTLDVLYEVAYRAHLAMPASAASTEEDANTADIPVGMLVAAFEKLLEGERVNDADLRAYLRDRAGLLIDAGGDDDDRVYKFPHRLIQEYMTARYVSAKRLHLKAERDGLTVLDRLASDWTRWREVYALAALDCADDAMQTASWARTLLKPKPGVAADPRLTALAVEILADKLGERAERPDRLLDDSVTDQLDAARTAAIGVFETPLLMTPRERNDMARRLAELPSPDPERFVCADTRLGVCANLRTPAGIAEYVREGFALLEPKPFLLQGNYKTQIKAKLLVARTPLTWAQFEPFVESGGYREARFWSVAGLEWRGERAEPYYWHDRDERIKNHPANGITWFESAAWCAWFSEQTRAAQAKDAALAEMLARLGAGAVQCRLLTETEWEFAARGDTLRKFPWKAYSNQTWEEGDSLRCNMDETGIGRTSAAGLFPYGATPEQIFDLSGNVWEWCQTISDKDVSEDKNGDNEEGSRVLRGGAFVSDGRFVSASVRPWDGPDGINGSLGCRVGLSLLGTSDL